MSQDVNIVKPFFNLTTESINYANLCVLGIPWDFSSTYRKGSHQSPIILRSATSGALYNTYAETGVNLKEKWQIFDIGDANITNNKPVADRNKIFEYISKYNQYSMKFLFLGGDHLSTYFSFWSLKQFEEKKIGLIYLDAHPDLYENYEGNKYSHACVVRRIIEDTHMDPESIVQVGIRASTPEQDQYASSKGIKTITTKEFQANTANGSAELVKSYLPKNLDAIYLSVDLDVLDPAYAPGVGNPQPGGLSTREVIDFIHGLQGLKISAFDITELCPSIDYSGITAFAGAKIIQETLGTIPKE
ncbi:MAG: agmatinase [Candidatus Heimdallarchaeota archaeon]